MSDILMDLVKGAVSKQVMGSIGGLLGGGQSEEKTQSAFEHAAGSILGGLIKKSESAGGAEEIFKAASTQDAGVLDKLGDILGGGSVNEDFQKQGGGILDMVFGANRSGILGTLAKFLGFGGDSKKSGLLMSIAAPIIMGVIGRYIKSKALNAVGLGKFLGDQKQSLAGFMPADLTKDLGFGNMLGSLTGAAGGAANAVGDAVGSVGGAARDAVGSVGGAARDAAGAAGGMARDGAKAGGSILTWLLPLIIIGALGYLAYTFISSMNGPAEVTQNENDGTPPSIGAGGGGIAGAASGLGLEMPSFDGIDLGGFEMGGLKEKFDGITGGFEGLNAESAPGLVDKITGLTTGMKDMGFDKIPDAAKGTVGKAVEVFQNNVNGSMEKVTDQGVLGMIKPVLQKLWDAFKGMGFLS